MIDSLFLIDRSAVGTYYVSLKIMNKSGKNIVIESSDNDQPREVKKGFMMIYTRPTKGNSEITFKARDSASQQLMNINGKDFIKVVPTEVKGPPTTAEVLAPGMSAG